MADNIQIGDYRKSLMHTVIGRKSQFQPKAVWILVIIHRDYKRCDEALLRLISRGITGPRFIDWYLEITGGVDPREAEGHRTVLYRALNTLLDDPHGAHESDIHW